MDRKILIVDDDQVIRLLLDDYLSSYGYLVSTLESGIQALEELSKVDLPDAVLLDFQMPVMSGLEVLRGIRENERTRNLPIIMLSANRETEQNLESEGLQVDRFLLKPFDMPEITKALKELLD